MQDIGGDILYQNIFAEVLLYGTRQTVQSEVIDVDRINFRIPKPEGVKVVTVKDNKKEKNCGQKHCIKKGDKSELIREINIRLAGFGGNVPTDEFTDRTEKMIKQFQRDYMKVAETGKICGNVLKAIDLFSSKYELPSNVWKKRGSGNPHEMLCPCGVCSGFGSGKYSEQKQSSKVVEAHRKYEYPGIHRSLLWSLKAVLFYLNKTNSSLGYSLKYIESGYRCHERNKQRRRSSTNHMGKALDLHFDKNGKRANSIKEMEDIRLNIFNKYLGAKWDWINKNIFNLESTSVGAVSWVHYDVREFDSIYLKDEYFTKTQIGLNGKSVVTLAKELGYINTCNCLGISETEKNNIDSVCSHCKIFDNTANPIARENYYKLIGTKMISYTQSMGVPNKFKALYMLAQRRSENGFRLNTPANNPMNIKARGDLGNISLNTKETTNGKTENKNESFGSFSSEEAGFNGYIEQLKRNWEEAYESLITENKTIENFTYGLQYQGRLGVYATGIPKDKMTAVESYKKDVEDNFYNILSNYKKWYNCMLTCPSLSEKINDIKKDIELLNKLK